MAYETILTILFALGVGAAIIVYAARPRHGVPRISVAHASAIESYSPAESFEPAPMPQVTAVHAPEVDTSTPDEVHAYEAAPVVVAEVAAAGPSETPSFATATVDVSAAAPIATSDTATPYAQTTTRAHRTQRRRSTATKAHAKPSQRTSRKHS
jgi:hypothetical protein